MNYSEKLKDPRWQKKRLEVFERDEWRCQKCFDDQETLCVHHLRYVPGWEPWDYPINKLLTLCEGCHAEEYELMPEAIGSLVEQIKDKGFMCWAVMKIASGINQLTLRYPPDVTASIIEYILSDTKAFNEIAEMYFKGISTKNNGDGDGAHSDDKA